MTLLTPKTLPTPPAPITDLAPGANPGPAPALTVLFDGACPLCRREVAVYQGLAALQPLRWCDVSAATGPALAAVGLDAGVDRSLYLRRFHVRLADGRMLSGAAAFVALWSVLPGWRWLGRLGGLPPVTWLLERAYRGFLVLRPGLQRLARRLEPGAGGGPAVTGQRAVSGKMTGTAVGASIVENLSPAMVAELRSDHAGETGAVWIYRGVLAVDSLAGRCGLRRDPALARFARRHLSTELDHLRQISAVLPWRHRSRLLLPWRMAGFMTGALPALAGPRAVYATIAAVETFVVAHYQQQIEQLDATPDPALDALRALLIACQADEAEHRDQATASAGAVTGAAAPTGRLIQGWCALVGSGSALAVRIARRI